MGNEILEILLFLRKLENSFSIAVFQCYTAQHFHHIFLMLQMLQMSFIDQQKHINIFMLIGHMAFRFSSY